VADESSTSHALQKVLDDAESELSSADPSPYSERAFSLLKEKIEEYASELVSESIKVSRRQRTDTVSAAHVQRASDFLIAGTGRRIFRHLGTLGGTLVGVSLSLLASMILSAEYRIGGVTASVTFGIIGGFLVALHIAKD